MGTSKAYSASIKGQPQWGGLSGAVTRNCSNDQVSSNNLGKILSRYVDVVGGASKAGRGKSNIGGKAGLRAARNIGAFLGAFGNSRGDIRTAFEQIGLSGLNGLTLSEVIDRLIEHCSGPAATLDDVAAKAASEKILEELSVGSTTIDEWQLQLQEILDKESIEEIVERYFAFYIFEHLSIMFYEKLVVEKGKQECANLFIQIRDFIFEKVKHMNKTNPVNSIDWASADAQRLMSNIQEDVLKVFEGYES